MIQEVIQDAKIRMEKCVESFKNQINKLHTGRASTCLIDDMLVKYYGILTPLNKLANITVENSNTLKISLFDPSMTSSVEKLILTSNLNFGVSSTESDIRVFLPLLTEERRKNLIKLVRNEAEQTKIVIRNIRRYSNDKIKSLLKEKKISEDEDRKSKNNIQKITNFSIKNIDIILEKKEIELIKF